ncbi:MAG: hypothetical protein AB8G96_03830 [Phycisphaerales bacterium]
MPHHSWFRHPGGHAPVSPPAPAAPPAVATPATAARWLVCFVVANPAAVELGEIVGLGRFSTWLAWGLLSAILGLVWSAAAAERVESTSASRR